MSKIKVVICEDHALFREGIKAYLNNRQDIECVGEAENGAQLMFLLRSRKSQENFPDIVLLDINMPIMGGEETLELLKQEHPELKVIMLTMHNQVSMVEKMMGLGANSYVPKTEASDQIVKAILSVYGTNYYFNDLINQALVQSVRRSSYTEKKEEPEEPLSAYYSKEEEQDAQETGKKRFGWAKKTLLGVVYGLLAALVLSLVVYVALVIYSSMSALNSSTFNY